MTTHCATTASSGIISYSDVWMTWREISHRTYQDITKCRHEVLHWDKTVSLLNGKLHVAGNNGNQTQNARNYKNTVYTMMRSLMLSHHNVLLILPQTQYTEDVKLVFVLQSKCSVARSTQTHLTQAIQSDTTDQTNIHNYKRDAKAGTENLETTWPKDNASKHKETPNISTFPWASIVLQFCKWSTNSRTFEQCCLKLTCWDYCSLMAIALIAKTWFLNRDCLQNRKKFHDIQ